MSGSERMLSTSASSGTTSLRRSFSVTPARKPKVIEIIGEGKSDVGKIDDNPRPPTEGVVAILVHKLCGSPTNLLVRRRKPLFLQRSTKLWRRVMLSKRRAEDAGDDALIYVQDTEGDHPGVL